MDLGFNAVAMLTRIETKKDIDIFCIYVTHLVSILAW